MTSNRLLAVGLLLVLGCRGPEARPDPAVTTARLRSTGNSPAPAWVRGPVPEASDEESYFRGIKTKAATLEEGKKAAREDARKQCLEAIPAWGRSPEAQARGLKEAGAYWEWTESTKAGKVIDAKYDVYILMKFSSAEFPQKEAVHLRGLKELSRGNLKDAVACFEQAISLDPAFAEAHYSLAQAYEKSAEGAAGGVAARRAFQKKALEAYGQFLTLAPGGDRAKVAAGQLAKIKSEICAGLVQEARKAVADRRFQEALEALAEAYRLSADEAAKEAIYQDYYSAAAEKALQSIEACLPALAKGLEPGQPVRLGVKPFLTVGGAAVKEGELLQQSLLAGLTRLDKVAVAEGGAAAKEPPRALVTGSVGQSISIKLLDAKSDTVLAFVNVFHLGPSVPLAPAPPGGRSEAPIELETSILAERRAGEVVRSVLVTEGAALQSRDQFQVHFKTSREAYAYIIIFDSTGKAVQLFPDPQIKLANKVQAQTWYAVPDENRWFWLDDNTGTETIYVVASAKPLEDVAGLLADMEKAGSNLKTLLAQAAKMKGLLQVYQRGVGGVSDGPKKTWNLADGRKVEQVTEVVKGWGSAVRVISFEHR